VFIFNERHLQKVLAEYVGYFNRWRHTVRLDNVRPARQCHLRRIDASKREGS